MLCNPIRHMSSHSDEAGCELLYSVYFYFTLLCVGGLVQCSDDDDECR